MGKTKSKKIKNVLLLTPDFPPEKGGIQRLMHNLAKALKILGYDVEVWTLQKKSSEDFDRFQDFNITRLRTIGKRKINILCSFFIHLPYILLKKIDLVISGHITTTIIGILIKKIKNIPLLTYTHAIEIMDLRYKKINTFLLKNSDTVIAVSNFTADFIKNMGIKNVITVYPPFSNDIMKYKKINKNRIKKELGLDKKIILSTIARCDAKERYKGIDTVISILPELIKRFNNIHYIVIGGGNDLERLKRLSREYGIESNITFTNSVSDEELAKYLSISDIFILVSKEIVNKKCIKAEGFGIVFLEAQGMGIPVIGGRSGGIPEIIIDGETGLLANPTDPIDIKEKIEILIRNDNLKKKLVKNAKERIEKEFTLDCYTKKIRKIIENI